MPMRYTVSTNVFNVRGLKKINRFVIRGLFYVIISLVLVGFFYVTAPFVVVNQRMQRNVDAIVIETPNQHRLLSQRYKGELRKLKSKIMSLNTLTHHIQNNYTASIAHISRHLQLLLFSHISAKRHIYGQISKQKNRVLKRDITVLKEELDTFLANLHDLNYKTQIMKHQLQGNVLKRWGRVLIKRFERIQSKKNCTNLSTIQCSNKGCGHGCYLHNNAYCQITSYSTGRPISGVNRRFTGVLQSIANNRCRNRNGVDKIPIIDSAPAAVYLPQAVPADLASALAPHHAEPFVWFVGHVLAHMMRPTAATRAALRQQTRTLRIGGGGGGSSGSKTVGVHIRRTDKLNREAKFHGLAEYMHHVEEFYDVEEKRRHGGHKGRRRVFIASDDPNVITEAQRDYPQYEVLFVPQNAQRAGESARHTAAGELSFVLDVTLLSHCDHIVCTFSSQVCRVAYELMQTRGRDASGDFVSLDDVYYYGGHRNVGWKATGDFPVAGGAVAPGQIRLRSGDALTLHGDRWDGYADVSNRRTGERGNVPAHLVVKTLATFRPQIPYNDGGFV